MIIMEGLSVRYDGLYALKNINLSIDRSGIVCIMGPNSAGKTTMLKSFAKMIRFEGAIIIDGLEIAKTPLKTISKILSYSSHLEVPEFISLTVEEALLTARYPATKTFLDTGKDREFLWELADELEIRSLLKRRLSELSSGELQRVVLGLALAKNPKYLLLDEPDSHMDIRFKSKLVGWIKKWSLKHRIIMTTHDILFGFATGDYFILLDNGRIVFSGDRDELWEKYTVLEKVYDIKLLRISYDNQKYLVPIY